jgi:hypothetical protein
MALACAKRISPPWQAAPHIGNGQGIDCLQQRFSRDMGVVTAHIVNGVSQYLIFDVRVDTIDYQLR